MGDTAKRDALLSQRLVEWQADYHDYSEEELAEQVADKYSKYLKSRQKAYDAQSKMADLATDIEKHSAKLSSATELKHFAHLNKAYFYDLSTVDSDRLDDLRALHVQREKSVGKWWRSEVDKLKNEFAMHLPSHQEMERAQLDLGDLIKLSNQSWASFINKPADDEFRKEYLGILPEKKDESKDDEEVNLEAEVAYEEGTVFGTDGNTGKDEAEVKAARKEEREREQREYHERLEKERLKAEMGSDDEPGSDDSVDTVDELMDEFREEEHKRRYDKKLAKASAGLSEEQIATFKAGFDVYDDNSSGFITITELGNCMRKLGQKPTDHELHVWMERMDTDRSGSIDFAEFLSVMGLQLKEENAQREKIAKAKEDLTPQQIASIEASFKKHDANGDGTISTTELQTMLNALGLNPKLADLMAMVRDADTDNDGFLDYAEFMELTSKNMKRVNRKERDLKAAKEFLSAEELKTFQKAFDTYDVDGNGTINRDEVFVTLTKLGQYPNKEELAVIMDEYDTDEDGVISFEEFLMVMGRTLRDRHKRLIEATENLTPEQVANLKTAFAVYDKSGDGQVTVTELGTALRGMGRNHSVAELKQIMKDFGVEDESGFIDLPIFINVMGREMKEANKRSKLLADALFDLSESEVKLFEQAFNKFATKQADGTNKLASKDLSKTLKELALLCAISASATDETKDNLIINFTLPKTVSEMKKMLELFEADEEGNITFASFVNVVAKETKAKNAAVRIKKQERVDAESDLTSKQLGALRRVFKSYDLDGSGTINPKELMLVLRRMGHEVNPTQLKAMMKEYDTDDSGSVSYVEFLNMTGKAYKADNIRRRQLREGLRGLDEKQKQNLLQIFEDADEHKQGKLSIKQLSVVAKKLGMKTTVAEFKRLVTAIDPDETGYITLISFVQILGKNLREIALAQKDLTPGQLEQLKKAFARYDTQRSGTIDIKKIDAVLKDLQLPVSAKQRSELVLDLTGGTETKSHGRVEYANYVRGVGKVMHDYAKKLTDACKGIDHDEIRSIKALFDEFDSDKNGFLNTSELSKVLRKNKQKPTTKDLKQIMAVYDKDKNGVVDFPEFLLVVAAQAKREHAKKQLVEFACDGLSRNQVKELRDSFDAYDTDHSGSVSAKELAAMLRKMGQNLTGEEVLAMVTRIDTDNSGTIEFYEYVQEAGKKMKEENRKYEHTSTFSSKFPEGFEDEFFNRLNGIVTADMEAEDAFSEQTEALYIRAYGAVDPIAPPEESVKPEKPRLPSNSYGSKTSIRRASAAVPKTRKPTTPKDSRRTSAFSFNSRPNQQKKPAFKSRLNSDILELSDDDEDYSADFDTAPTTTSSAATLMKAASKPLASVKEKPEKSSVTFSSKTKKPALSMLGKSMGLDSDDSLSGLSDDDTTAATSVMNTLSRVASKPTKGKPESGSLRRITKPAAPTKTKSNASSLLLSAVSEEPKSTSSQSKAVECENCESKPAVEDCEDCDMKFCEECGNDFHMAKKTKSHNRKPLRGSKSGNKSKALEGLFAAQKATDQRDKEKQSIAKEKARRDKQPPPFPQKKSAAAGLLSSVMQAPIEDEEDDLADTSLIDSLMDF